MIKSGLVAMGLALVATTAAAEPRPTMPEPVPAKAPAKVDAKRYCVVEIITGSRLPQRECHSRGEWQTLGFDPLAAK